MNIELLQNKWKSLDCTSESDHKLREVAVKIMKRRSSTLQAKLRHRYLRSAIIGVVAPLMLIPLNEVMTLSTLFIWSYILFFAIMSPVNFYISYRASHLDPANMTTLEAVDRIISFRKLVTLCLVGGIILMIPVLIIIFSALVDEHDEAALIGGIIGGVIGGVISIIQTTRTYRQITELRRMIDDK